MSRLADPVFEEIYSLYRDINQNCIQNGSKIQTDLEPLVENFRTLQKLTNSLKKNVETYDSKTGTKANGYRSLIRVVGTLVRHCVEVLETVKHQLSTLGYVSEEARGDVAIWISVIERLIEILKVAEEIKSVNTHLYPEQPNSQSAFVVETSMKALEMDLTPFYGNALGFHLRGDSRRMMHPLAISMASYSDIYGGRLFGNHQCEPCSAEVQRSVARVRPRLYSIGHHIQQPPEAVICQASVKAAAPATHLSCVPDGCSDSHSGEPF